MKSQVHDVWRRWKVLAHTLGMFESRLILSIFFLVLLAPVAIIFSFVVDVLHIRKKGSSTWTKRVNKLSTLEELRAQY